MQHFVTVSVVLTIKNKVSLYKIKGYSLEKIKNNSYDVIIFKTTRNEQK